MRTAVILAAAVLMGGGSAWGGEGPAKAAAPPAKAAPVEARRISPPVTYENLTVFLIRGPDRIKGKKFLTLQEAMAGKKLVIEETGNVNRLIVINNSDVSIYIQSGDIIKGGKQDRVLQHDIIIPPNSGKQPISAFCVEQGRWQRRGGEDVANFSSSDHALNSRSLKLAAKLQADQGTVWRAVDAEQGKLSANTRIDVTRNASGSSLQLSLENKKVKEMTDAYLAKVGKLPKDQKDIVGLAFAVNGKVSTVDIYASSALFRKLWPKLIRSAATEALAELDKKTEREPANAQQVRDFIVASRKAQEKASKNVNDRVLLKVRESKAQAAFDTYDKDGDGLIHESILAK